MNLRIGDKLGRLRILAIYRSGMPQLLVKCDRCGHKAEILTCYWVPDRVAKCSNCQNWKPPHSDKSTAIECPFVANKPILTKPILTSRDRAILPKFRDLVYQGYTILEIKEKLGLTVYSVNKYSKLTQKIYGFKIKKQINKNKSKRFKNKK